MTTDRRDEIDRSPAPVAADGEPAPTSERLLHLAVAAAIAILGVVIVLEARDVRVLPTHSRVGPRVIPYLIGTGLIVVGAWLAIEAWTGRAAPPGGHPSEEAEDVDTSLPPDWACLGMIAVGLLVYWFLMERAGFVVSTSLLFYFAAYGMGSRQTVRDVAIAVGLSIVVYVVFTEGLNLRLPAGWLDEPGAA